MYTCKICKRKFRSIKALGGHTSSAHPSKSIETTTEKTTESSVAEVTTKEHLAPQSQPANTQEQTGTESQQATVQEQPEAKEDEPGIMETIREYKRRGLSASQIKELGYNRRTVDDVFLEYMEPENEPEEGEHGVSWRLPVLRKQTEVLESEALLRSYSDGSDQDQAELRGMMKLRAAMLMVMELAHIEEKFASAEAKRLEPILKVLREGREELDAAAARAKASSFEMAQQAAQSAVGGVVQYLEDKEAKAPPPPPPKTMDETMARRVDKVVGKMTDMMWGMMESRMFPQQAGGNLPEGWEYQGSPSQPQPAQGNPQGWTVEKEKDEEQEAESND